MVDEGSPKQENSVQKPIVSAPKDARETTDGLYLQEQDLLRVDENGTPTGHVLIDLEDKDIAAFWEHHEQTLWIITILCSLFFLNIIFSGGI